MSGKCENRGVGEYNIIIIHNTPFYCNNNGNYILKHLFELNITNLYLYTLYNTFILNNTK